MKLIFDVLYVPEINQNLLSVTLLLEKGYKVMFEDKNYVIKDTKDRKSIQSSNERQKLCVGFNERRTGFCTQRR